MAKNTPPVKCYWSTDFVDELVKILETYKDDDRFENESKYMNYLIDKINTYRRDNDDGGTSLFFFEREASELLFILLAVIVCKDGAIEFCDEIINGYKKLANDYKKLANDYKDGYNEIINGYTESLNNRDNT